MEESKKVPIIFTRDQIESMDNFIKENEGYSRSSFVREAVEYYLGYIDMNENVNYISPLINQNIKLILSRFEAKMSEMIFKIVRLLGSAFIISVAEELFFRRWLMRFAGFWWMVALFAVEHDRWLVGAIAGVLYGWLALRKGLLSAIIAHVTTNLALGLYVLETGNWQFW